MLYEIKKLIKRYEDRIVLDLPDLSFQSGDIIGLLGPNGAGKTTLLEILAFILHPTTGEIYYKQERADFSSSKIHNLRQKVVLVQQNPILFSTTVYKNVEFPLRIRKKDKTERKKVTEELLRLVGMEDFGNAKGHHLSGGETQRVAIAQALACAPDVILMDEPTASVDVENQITIERIIQEINRDKGISVIFTTHDMIQASRIAHKTMFLFEGRVAESIHENIFSGQISTNSAGRKYCVFPNNKRFYVKTEKSGPVRVSIIPDLLTVLPSNNNTSDSNTYKGTLLQLTHELDRIRALVDVGMPISVLIPTSVSDSLPLRIGEDIWLTCPPESFRFL